MTTAFRHPQRLLLILAIAVSAAAIGCSEQSTPKDKAAGNAAGKVEIADFAFNPNQIEIKEGEDVSWVNMDTTPHTVTVDDPASGVDFDRTLDPEEAYTFKFDKKGTYSYHCKIHSQMNGKVVVE